MSISPPVQIKVPFATSGLRNSIPAAANPITGNAGYDQGFTATNMTPLTAGGIAPFGQDFNGVFFDITTAIQYLEAGGSFPYSSTFSTAVGGYPIGAIVSRTDSTGLWRNTVANNMTDPEAFGAGWQPEMAGISTIAMAGANVTLTALQSARQTIIITGALTANLQLIFPTYQYEWSVINNATGAFSVTCKTASGSGVSISTGASLIVYGDGTNIVNIPLGGTGTTAPQFDNSTKFATTAFVQGVGLQFSNVTLASANITLTAAAHAGALIVGNSSSAISVTLPAVSTIPAKVAIKFWNYAAGTMTLIAAGADSIYLPASVTLFAIPTGSSITLVSSGAGVWFAVGSGQQVGVKGAASNLVVSTTGISAIVTITADEIVLESSAGIYQTLRGVSVTPSLAVPGVGGLDTGTSASSTWYSVWIIWNGSTVSGLLSLSSTNPTMPAGYTYKARVGWVRTDATGNKYPLSFLQKGRRAQYVVSASSNVQSLPLMASGSAGTYSTTSPVYVAVSAASFIPTATASRIQIALQSNYLGGAGSNAYVAPNNSYGGVASINSPPINTYTGGSTSTAQSGELMLESTNIYYVSQAAGGAVQCIGWEDNL